MYGSDTFSDDVNITINQLGACITFCRSTHSLINDVSGARTVVPSESEVVSKIRMTPAMMKLLAMVLRKAVKTHEGIVGALALDPQYLNEAGISVEDW